MEKSKLFVGMLCLPSVRPRQSDVKRQRVHHLDSSQLVQFPCLADRESAVRIHLGLVNETMAIGISGQEDVPGLEVCFWAGILPNLDMRDVRLF